MYKYKQYILNFNACKAMDCLKQQTFIKTTKFSNASDTMKQQNACTRTPPL